MTKIMGKAFIWTISRFWALPSFNIVEKQWAKLASRYVMGSQHCIGGREGIFKQTFWDSHNILSLIVWNLLKKKKKREKDEVLCMLSQICFNELDYVMKNYHKWQKTAPKWRITYRSNGFKLLLFGTCQKRVITSTSWQML